MSKPSWWPELSQRILFPDSSEYMAAELYGREVARALIERIEVIGSRTPVENCFHEILCHDWSIEEEDWAQLKKECLE